MTPPRDDPWLRKLPRASASDPFRRWRVALLVGLLLSAAIHVLALGLSPVVRLSGGRTEAAELQAVRLPAPEPPPDVDIPPAPEPVRRPAPPAESEPGGVPSPAEGPTFIPHDVLPRLVNGDEIRSFLQQFYPPVMKELGLEGRVLLWLYLDERGNVVETRIRRSSGHRAFDELARTMAPLMRFRPALNHGQTTPVWVSLPLRFELQPDTSPATEAASPGAPPGDGGRRPGPPE